MPPEKYRTGIKRIGAAIVDGTVFMPLLFLDQWLFRSTENITILMPWTIFITFGPCFYRVILHYKFGQTIGKWVVDVKVVDINETKTLTFARCILRDIFYLSLELIGIGYFFFLAIKRNSFTTFFEDFRDFSATPLWIWFLLQLIIMFSNSKRRGIHDFIAGSVVIRTQSANKIA